MKRKYITSLAGAAATLTAAGFVRRYRRDLGRARGRALTGSTVIDTGAGPIEYAQAGEGEPVMVVHGAGGGHDQGMLVARLVGEGFRWIAPSRFGYLRTPQREVHTPEVQADAHAALLDALEVPAVSVVGVSAGAPSALSFAARHRERCRSVVLFAGLTRSAPRRSPALEALFRYGFRSDALLWALGKASRGWVRKLVGAPPEMIERLSARERVWLDDFLDSFLPIAPRHEGVVADMLMFTTHDLLSLPLEEIRVPVMAFQARDDTILPYAMLQYLSEYVPHARAVSFDEGGHLLLGHHDEVASMARDFLHETASVGEHQAGSSREDTA
jgi:pimeloyl-ACP methyl ester carboxylesterase